MFKCPWKSLNGKWKSFHLSGFPLRSFSKLLFSKTKIDSLQGRLIRLWAFDFNQDRQPLNESGYDGKSCFYHVKMVCPTLFDSSCRNEIFNSMKFTLVFWFYINRVSNHGVFFNKTVSFHFVRVWIFRKLCCTS